MKHALLKGKKLEWFILVLFTIGLIIISVFHEPWFDEAQAWEIAKGASLKEILFVIPHYEGHPPLWHLILAIPAKLGVPFEIGLKTIGIIISVATASILLFFSKLPRFARLALPFSYFFFYQYGVIVRPYGLMLLIFLLLGMNLAKRKTHPWRIFILLGLLCLCSAYGIVFAGGIAICLVIEILKEQGLKQAFRSFFKNPQTLSLLALLILAVLLIVEIMPRPDTYYAAATDKNSFFLCLLCALLIFPTECFLTTSSWFSVDQTLLQIADIDATELIPLCVIGVIIWVLVLCSASKKNILFLIIPYSIFAIFSSSVYFSAHHLGVVFSFFLFWTEFISGEEKRFEIGGFLIKKIISREKDYRLFKKIFFGIGIVCISIPIYWNIMASVNDIRYEYYYGRSVAAFIKEHKLDNSLILGSWNESESQVPASSGNEKYVNTALIGNAVPINAYFDKNIFYNLNHNNSHQGFIFYRRPTLEESEKDLEEWVAYGIPEVIIGKPDLESVFGDELTYDDYKLVFLAHTQFIWKTTVTFSGMPVFLREDLLSVYHLESLDSIEYAMINGFQITDEMKERYYNGEPVEEILKPYLDALFGSEK